MPDVRSAATPATPDWPTPVRRRQVPMRSSVGTWPTSCTSIRGDPLQVFVFNQIVTFTVRGIVPRVGLAGFHPGFGAQAENVFVAPGTLDALAAKAPRGATGPEGRVLVSNVGGVFSGASKSDAVALELQIRTAGIPGVEVTSEKKGELDFADRQGSSFTQLFGLIGGFTVVAGVLLLINIFVMLAEERKSELGMLRALGLKRNHLVRAFGLEGTMYALTAAVVGAAAGIGVGRVVVSVTEGIFSQGDRQTTLQFSVRADERAHRLRDRARDLAAHGVGHEHPHRTAQRDPRHPRPAGAARLGASVANVAARGGRSRRRRPAARHGPDALIARARAGRARAGVVVGGAALVALRVAPPGRHGSVRRAVALCIVGAFTLLPSTFANPGIEVFFAQGIVLVFTAVAIAVTNGDEFHRVSDRLSASGRGLATRLGLANPLAKRFRTALLLGMYALIMFVLVFMSVFAAVFQAQGPQVADDTRRVRPRRRQQPEQPRDGTGIAVGTRRGRRNSVDRRAREVRDARSSRLLRATLHGVRRVAARAWRARAVVTRHAVPERRGGVASSAGIAGPRDRAERLPVARRRSAELDGEDRRAHHADRSSGRTPSRAHRGGHRRRHRPRGERRDGRGAQRADAGRSIVRRPFLRRRARGRGSGCGRCATEGRPAGERREGRHVPLAGRRPPTGARPRSSGCSKGSSRSGS